MRLIYRLIKKVDQDPGKLDSLQEPWPISSSSVELASLPPAQRVAANHMFLLSKLHAARPAGIAYPAPFFECMFFRSIRPQSDFLRQSGHKQDAEAQSYG